MNMRARLTGGFWGSASDEEIRNRKFTGPRRGDVAARRGADQARPITISRTRCRVNVLRSGTCRAPRPADVGEVPRKMRPVRL
jgi:hypothetical protein